MIFHSVVHYLVSTGYMHFFLSCWNVFNASHGNVSQNILNNGRVVIYCFKPNQGNEVIAMSKAKVYRSPVEAALSLKSELEGYERDKDRRPLVNAVMDQFLLNRLVASSQAESVRDLALQLLRDRMDHMSGSTLLKAIKVLSEAGAQDLTAVTGTPVSRARTPMVYSASVRSTWGRLPVCASLDFHGV
jgi:hypothetical protein